MSSEMPSEKSLVLKYLDKMGRISLFTRMKASLTLARSAEHRQQMIEAEDRKAADLMQWKLQQEDDMGDTVLGDVHNHPPKQSSSLAKVAGIAALALGGPAAGYVANDIVSKLTADPPAVSAPEDSDTLFELEILPTPGN